MPLKWFHGWLPVLYGFFPMLPKIRGKRCSSWKIVRGTRYSTKTQFSLQQAYIDIYMYIILGRHRPVSTRNDISFVLCKFKGIREKPNSMAKLSGVSINNKLRKFSRWIELMVAGPALGFSVWGVRVRWTTIYWFFQAKFWQFEESSVYEKKQTHNKEFVVAEDADEPRAGTGWSKEYALYRECESE